jgi:Nif-specific regulatory protein
MDNGKFNTQENKLQRFIFDCEKTVIHQALVRTKGNITAAARLLGTTRRILTYKVHKYGIDYEQLKCGLNILKEN